jgi:flavin reductase (DIM6/NTAB) family NADH-FMN oxidoreductase RutF
MNKKALYNLTYGVYLLTAQENGRDNGCIINTAVQVANNPTRVSIAAIKGNLTHDMIKNTGVFNVSVLSEDAPFELFRHFGFQSGRTADKFAGWAASRRSANGVLHLTACANAYLSAKVVDMWELETHTVFLAEVTEMAPLSAVPSMTYAYYHAEVKPKPQPVKKKGYVCNICGHIYEGETLPADYVCPLCKHGAEDFSPLS